MAKYMLHKWWRRKPHLSKKGWAILIEESLVQSCFLSLNFTCISSDKHNVWSYMFEFSSYCNACIMSLSLLLYGKCNAICSMYVLTLLQDLVTALISEIFLLQFFNFSVLSILTKLQMVYIFTYYLGMYKFRFRIDLLCIDLFHE